MEERGKMEEGLEKEIALITDYLSITPSLMVVREGCSFCVKAEKLLKSNGILFKKFSVEKELELNDAIKKVWKYKTFPKIFITKKFIGGYDDLVIYLNSQ